MTQRQTDRRNTPVDFHFKLQKKQEMKKALGETQTLRAGRVTRRQKISPRRRPLPGAQDRQNLISWRWSLLSPTDPVWWKSMHAISSYRGNRPTPPARCKPTDRTDNSTLRR